MNERHVALSDRLWNEWMCAIRMRRWSELFHCLIHTLADLQIYSKRYSSMRWCYKWSYAIELNLFRAVYALIVSWRCVSLSFHAIETYGQVAVCDEVGKWTAVKVNLRHWNALMINRVTCMASEVPVGINEAIRYNSSVWKRTQSYLNRKDKVQRIRSLVDMHTLCNYRVVRLRRKFPQNEQHVNQSTHCESNRRPLHNSQFRSERTPVD